MDWIITHTYILFLWAWSHFLSSPPQKGYQTKQGINNQHKYNMVTLPSILVDSLLLLLEPGFQTPLLLPGCRFCLKMIIIRSTKLWSYVQNNLPESTSFKNSIPAKPPPHLHLHLVPLHHPLPRFWKKKRVVFQCFVGYKTRLREKKKTHNLFVEKLSMDSIQYLPL